MGFTREQLEKIISEAPEGAEYYTPGYAAEYRKITSGDSYYGFVDNEWVEAIDRWLSIERINKVFKLIELAEQLQEMKIQESKQAEIDNTAQQVESLSKEGECDTEDALELKNGDDVWDVTHVDFGGVFIGSIDGDGVIQCNDDHSLIRVRLCDLSKEKPLTPEQKQQQVDEQNGELFFELMSKVSRSIHGDSGGYGSYSSFCQGNQMVYIQVAKQVTFEGKLESI